MVTSIFGTTHDAIQGRLIAATNDQAFGRAVLSALATSGGDPVILTLEIELLGCCDLPTSAGRWQLKASRSTRMSGDDLVLSTPPLSPSSVDPLLESTINGLVAAQVSHLFTKHHQ